MAYNMTVKSVTSKLNSIKRAHETRSVPCCPYYFSDVSGNDRDENKDNKIDKEPMSRINRNKSTDNAGNGAVDECNSWYERRQRFLCMKNEQSFHPNLNNVLDECNNWVERHQRFHSM